MPLTRNQKIGLLVGGGLGGLALWYFFLQPQQAAPSSDSLPLTPPYAIDTGGGGFVPGGGYGGGGGPGGSAPIVPPSGGGGGGYLPGPTPTPSPTPVTGPTLPPIQPAPTQPTVPGQISPPVTGTPTQANWWSTYTSLFPTSLISLISSAVAPVAQAYKPPLAYIPKMGALYAPSPQPKPVSAPPTYGIPSFTLPSWLSWLSPVYAQPTQVRQPIPSRPFYAPPPPPPAGIIGPPTKVPGGYI